MTSSFFPPYHVGGDATHVSYLSEELAKRGHEVHVIHSLDAYRIKRGKQLPSRELPNQRNLFIHTIESPLRTLDPLMIYALGNSFWVSRKFSQIVKEVNPEVVHHHNLSLLGYDLLRKRGNYLNLYTAHDYWLICQTNNLFNNQEEVCIRKGCYTCSLKSKRVPQIWRLFKPFKLAIQNIDLMISPSEFVRKRLMQEIAVRSITLPNFVPPAPAKISPICDEKYFLFLGMLEKHKGILNLLELFKKYRNNFHAKLIIAGGGSLSSYIPRFIEKNSLADLISFLGFVDNKTKYELYANALAVIIPSIWPENAPLVALESLSVGTPVITSNQGGLTEIIEKVDKKLIFNSFDELRIILSNFSKSKFPPKSVKQIYEQNFSPKVYVDKYINAIKRV